MKKINSFKYFVFGYLLIIGLIFVYCKANNCDFVYNLKIQSALYWFVVLNAYFWTYCVDPIVAKFLKKKLAK